LTLAFYAVQGRGGDDRIRSTARGAVQFYDERGGVLLHATPTGLYDGQGHVLAQWEMPGGTARDNGVVVIPAPEMRHSYLLVHYADGKAAHYSLVELRAVRLGEELNKAKAVLERHVAVHIAGAQLEAPQSVRLAASGSLAQGWLAVYHDGQLYSYAIANGVASSRAVRTRVAPRQQSGEKGFATHQLWAFTFRSPEQLLMAADKEKHYTLFTLSGLRGTFNQGMVVPTPRLNLWNGYRTRTGAVYGPLDGSRPEAMDSDTAWLKHYEPAITARRTTYSFSRGAQGASKLPLSISIAAFGFSGDPIAFYKSRKKAYQQELQKYSLDSLRNMRSKLRVLIQSQKASLGLAAQNYAWTWLNGQYALVQGQYGALQNHAASQYAGVQNQVTGPGRQTGLNVPTPVPPSLPALPPLPKRLPGSSQTVAPTSSQAAEDVKSTQGNNDDTGPAGEQEQAGKSHKAGKDSRAQGRIRGTDSLKKHMRNQVQSGKAQLAEAKQQAEAQVKNGKAELKQRFAEGKEKAQQQLQALSKDSLKKQARRQLAGGKATAKAALADAKQQARAQAKAYQKRVKDILAQLSSDSLKKQGAKLYAQYKAKAKEYAQAQRKAMSQQARQQLADYRKQLELQAELRLKQLEQEAGALAARQMQMAPADMQQLKALAEGRGTATAAVYKAAAGAASTQATNLLSAGSSAALGTVSGVAAGMGLSPGQTLAGLQQAARAARYKRMSRWYFGAGASVDFNKANGGAGETAQDSNSAQVVIDQLEGSAAIADTSGQLLFYTDGARVYNRLHRVMENGEGLMGHSSSTQGALIVPHPTYPDLYFLFTVDQGGYAGTASRGLNYSVVDMAENRGIGKVVLKNLPLEAHATEKLAATHHADGKAVWVVAHRSGSDAFVAFKVDQNGVNPTPVVSQAGSVHPAFGNGTIGQMKLSANSRLLALAIEATGVVEVFDFDTRTGIVGNARQLAGPVAEALLKDKSTLYQGIPSPYGVEFSPLGKKLYVTSWRQSSLYQYDLSALADSTTAQQTANNLEPVILSLRAIASPNPELLLGGLQLGPEGRLYAAQRTAQTGTGSLYLAGIQYPEADASAVGFNPTALHLGSGKSRMGLPTAIASLIAPPHADFTPAGNCVGKPILLDNYSYPKPGARWSWHILSDPHGTVSDTTALSTQAAPTLFLEKPGPYLLRLIATWETEEGLRRDTVTKPLLMFKQPQITLPGTEVLNPDGSAVRLQVQGHEPGYVYHWSTGATADYIDVHVPGMYTVRVMHGECTITATTRVLPAPTTRLTLNTDPSSSNTTSNAAQTNLPATKPSEVPLMWLRRAWNTLSPTLTPVLLFQPTSLNPATSAGVSATGISSSPISESLLPVSTGPFGLPWPAFSLSGYNTYLGLQLKLFNSSK
jgi:hypothetical protein